MFSVKRELSTQFVVRYEFVSSFFGIFQETDSRNHFGPQIVKLLSTVFLCHGRI